MELTPLVIAQLPAACRIATTMLTSPVLAHPSVPWLIRLPVAAGLAAILGPLSGTGAATAWSAATLPLVLIQEALVGSLLGLSLWLVVWALRLTAEMIENLSGFSLASVWDANSEATASGPLVRLYGWVAVALFVAVGGLGQLVAGVMNSFAVLPPATAWHDHTFAGYLAAALSSSFALALRTAIPALFALIGAAMVLGLVQRNFPQFGGVPIGLGVKSLTGILVTSLILCIMPIMLAGGLDNAMAHYETWLQQVAGR